LDDIIEIDEIVVTAKAPPRGFYANAFMLGKSYNKKRIDAFGDPTMRSLLTRLIKLEENYFREDSVYPLKYYGKAVRVIVDDWDVISLERDEALGTFAGMDDLETFMALPTARVDYIQIARDLEAYTFGFGSGGPLYGAVINVYTTDGLGLLSPRQTYNRKTINPPGYQAPAEFYSPKYDVAMERGSRTSDRRITLYWNPAVYSDEDGRASFRFYSSDLPDTEYSIVLEGITEQGKIVRAVGSVTVK
jgi:hypothetical protein